MTEKATPDTEDVDAPADPSLDGPGTDAPGPSAGAGGEADEEAESPDGADGSSPHGAEEPREATGEMDPEGALEELQEEYDELNDRHLRLAAEFTNYRRRQEAQMTEAWGRAQSDLLGRFLEVLDDLHRVSGLDPDDEAVSVQSIVEGVDLVERKFLRSLEEAGVEVLAPEGEPFDPEVMEAMMRVPAPSEEKDDVVAQVFQPGYVLKGHLVRPARVSVYKAE